MPRRRGSQGGSTDTDGLRAIIAMLDPDLDIDEALEHDVLTNRAGDLVYRPSEGFEPEGSQDSAGEMETASDPTNSETDLARELIESAEGVSDELRQRMLEALDADDEDDGDEDADATGGRRVTPRETRTPRRRAAERGGRSSAPNLKNMTSAEQAKWYRETALPAMQKQQETAAQ